MAHPEWPASSVTCRSRWTACSSPTNRCPQCNCGLAADLESIASLSGIERNLLPYWLTRYPDHPLAEIAARSPSGAAGRCAATARTATSWRCASSPSRRWRSGGCSRSPSNYTDPDAYFVGGGVVESAAHFRDWFLDAVRTATVAARGATGGRRFAVVADLDMAGARGSALAALRAIRPERDSAI